MRLANRVLLCALAIFVLASVASAQTLRNENDPRNIAPTVGTGGPTGGPTGLFTIYDGQTLRRGEFTFSVAYSNYDRDPGNVDITEIPVSFQIGINDYLELFFNTDAWRGIKVNSPAHLSGFYLPNINPRIGVPSRSSPAIILAPNQTQLTTLNSGMMVFRPANTQPFVPFPFVGGPGSNLGLFPPPPGARFGVPGGLNTTLGVTGAGGGNFGAASNFPGIGSPVGGILPGIVLTTRGIPPNLTFGPLTVPDLFTIAPSYLPDAPFIGRTFGESSFSTFTLGAKWRWTEPDNPFGIGVVGAYRWFWDKADDAGGFNQLQRGASPGGNFGDIGLTLFMDGRLSRSVNLSVNFGYWLNSSVRSEAFGGDAVLLDRPDEFHGGVGFDFPVNRHFQPIAELRFTRYVGGQTPNAFQNSPVDALLGFRAFPERWVGFGAAYRRHLNQQNGTVPAGFTPSEDANGFIAQFWIGHRNAREPDVLPNQAPVISSFAASTSTITVPCPPGQVSASGACPTTETTSVGLTTTATDPDGDTLLYTYSTTGGRITGDGANATWDLSGLAPGTYTASVEVDDGCGCISFSSTTVTIAECADCRLDRVCPQLSVTCPSEVDEGQPATFTANFTQGTPTVSETYNWTVSSGTITSGQGTSSITVDTTGVGGGSVTATVEVGGVDPSCDRTASCTVQIRQETPARKFDEYGNIRFNDEKARLDNYAIQLQNAPTDRATIIGYGTCEGEGLNRANRAKDYLVNTRGIDAGRIDTVDGGCRSELHVELWLVPSGATAPAADMSGAVSPCPECRRPTRRRRGRGEE
jgi:hypothetical protein